MATFCVTKGMQTYYVDRVSVQELKEAMYKYIREERAKGKPLGSIVYCWHPIRVGGKAP